MHDEPIMSLTGLTNLLERMCRVEPSADKEGKRYHKISLRLARHMLQVLRGGKARCPHCGEEAQIGKDYAIIE